MAEDYPDHDHTAEHAFIDYLETPTAEQAHATELAIARLQRRYDHLLRRLDGEGESPRVGVHRHNAWDHPEDCLGAVLHELAGALLEDRAETLAHGLEAANAMAARVDEARRYARLLCQYVTFNALNHVALEIPSEEADGPTG